jgi:hypothetical protein
LSFKPESRLALVAFLVRDTRDLDPDSGRDTVAMEGILIFDLDFGSRTASFAIASYIQFRDLAMQAGRRLGLDGNFICCSIQAKVRCVTVGLIRDLRNSLDVLPDWSAWELLV